MAVRSSLLFFRFLFIFILIDGQRVDPKPEDVEKNIRAGIAQRSEGLKYEKGRGGVEKNEREAVRLYTLAGNRGDAIAQNRLAHMFLEGRGVKQSDENAEKWLRLSAKQGNMKSQYALGMLHHRGKTNVITGREQKGYESTLAAAEQGHKLSQYNIALMLEQGHGVKSNQVEAARWFQKCADQGYSHAQYKLGLMYRQGRGVPQDDVEAARLFKLAADQGHVHAQQKLPHLASSSSSSSSLLSSPSSLSSSNIVSKLYFGKK